MYIIFTFSVRIIRVRVSVRIKVSASVRLQCQLANKVSVRCMYRSGE